MYYLYSENKDADQLRSYCAADLRLCFRICENRISHDAAHLVLIAKNNLYKCMFSASKVKIDVETNRSIGGQDITDVLDKLFREKYEEAMSTFMEDFMKRGNRKALLSFIVGIL